MKAAGRRGQERGRHEVEGDLREGKPGDPGPRGAGGARSWGARGTQKGAVWEEPGA